ncbi:MAG: hypothetical protein JRJ84_20730 [Deltaproteobacteria bacterium]|nr:hypothetical protein [Deltaproteobacteria bacterium]
MLPTLLAIVLTAPTASASQSHDPSDFDGTYDVQCVDTEMGLSLGLAVFTAEGTWATGTAGTAPLACDEVTDGDATWTEWYDETAKGCPDWLADEICEDLATGLTDLRAGVNNDMLATIPGSVDIEVQGTGNFWNRLFGIYPMEMTYHYDDGDASYGYLIDNNDGECYGDFVGAGVAAGLGTSGYFVCGVGSLAVVSGTIDRGTPFTYEATYEAGAELVCAAGNEAIIIAFSIGIAYAADLEGEAEDYRRRAVMSLPDRPLRSRW